MPSTRFYSLLTALLLGSFSSFAQQATNALPPQPATPKVYTYVEQMPAFPGGMEALNEYVRKNSRSGAQIQKRAPKTVAAAQAPRVFVQFLIMPDGQSSQAKVLKGLTPAYNEEALRLVRAMPRWTPGRQNGQPVAVQYILPFAFGSSAQ